MQKIFIPHTKKRRHTFILELLNALFVVLQVGRVKSFQLFQLFRCHQAKDGGSQREVVPLVQPFVPHVDCREVFYVVASPWLYVVHDGCHHCVQAVFGQ